MPRPKEEHPYALGKYSGVSGTAPLIMIPFQVQFRFRPVENLNQT